MLQSSKKEATDISVISYFWRQLLKNNYGRLLPMEYKASVSFGTSLFGFKIIGALKRDGPANLHGDADFLL